MLIPFQTVMMPLMQEMNSLTKTLGIPMKNSLGGLVFMYAGFGAGMGLPNMRRNADGFSIESQPGVGTTIQMEFRLK